MTLNLLQEHRDIKIIQYYSIVYKQKASHYYSNYFQHLIFRAIFGAISYIAFLTATGKLKCKYKSYSTSGLPVLGSVD